MSCTLDIYLLQALQGGGERSGQIPNAELLCRVGLTEFDKADTASSIHATSGANPYTSGSPSVQCVHEHCRVRLKSSRVDRLQRGYLSRGFERAGRSAAIKDLHCVLNKRAFLLVDPEVFIDERIEPKLKFFGLVEIGRAHV